MSELETAILAVAAGGRKYRPAPAAGLGDLVAVSEPVSRPGLRVFGPGSTVVSPTLEPNRRR